MNRYQFEVLTYIEKNGKKEYPMRTLSDALKISGTAISKALDELENEALIKRCEDQMEITERGLEALEPYRVKRAVIMAAGFGSRMVPITLNTPKPLVLVNGKKIIETLLDAVVKAEIPEIIIVTGYLGEQFEILLKKYPNIKFVHNKKYNEANNISSAYLIKDKFANSYVLESDLILYNPNLIRKYEYQSNFLGKYVDVTDDWCLETKNGIITKEQIGGYDCYQMYGISYYDEETAKKMELDIDKVYNMPGGKEKYWEQVMLDVCKKNYQIAVRPCCEGDIIEIDTFNELKAIDKTYDV